MAKHPTDFRFSSPDDEALRVDMLKAKLRAKSGKGPSRSKALREPHTSIAKVERDRSRKNSRTKGTRGELDVAKLFSKWCGETIRRTPMSGGWSNAKFGVSADLVCAKKAFPFSVEVKHHEGWVLDDLVTGVRKDHVTSIAQWWAQCINECPLKKTPLLVFRRNLQPWLVMCHASWVQEHANPRTYGRPHMVTATMYRTVDGCIYEDVVEIYTLDSFLGMILVPRGLKNYRGDE